MVLICSRNCATITTGLGQFHGPACAPLPEDIPYLLVVASFPPALGNPWSNFCLLLCLYGTLHMDGVIRYVLFVTKWFLSHCVLRFTCFVASHWLLNFTFSKSDFWWYFILNFSEKAMAPHSSTLAWKIPRMEKPGGLQSMGSLRVGHDWATSLSLSTFMHWRRKWQPTPVFLPGESQVRWSLVGCHLWDCTESNMTEAT